MKKLLYILFLLISIAVSAQQEDAWVYFTNKPDAGFYLANPLEMLSQKAIDRRAAHNIPLDVIDVPIHQAYIDGITASPGITVMAKSKWLNCLHVRGSEDAVNDLASLDFVDHIDFANKLLNTSGRPGSIQQPALVNKVMETQADFNYGTSVNQIQMLNGNVLHQQNFTGAGMTIAVLDAGFPGVDNLQPFQRLRDNNLILGGYNFVSQSDNFYSGGTHGMMVLSTMGGYTEGQLVGTAPDAFYYLFVTEDVSGENPVEESYWVQAAEMADSLGADVINTSLGYFIYDNPAYSYAYEDINGETAFITRGANIAFSRGMLCVTSAGNTANTANLHIGVPADAFNTLTVGAVNATEEYASFSSVGPSYDMRVKPDVMAQGVASALSGVDGSIGAANGTSFSSPITAGLVACLWQALPGLSNAEILQVVKQSADRYANPNIQYGYGIPDFAMALNDGLGLEDVKKQPFLIYPNPTQGVVNFVFPKGILSATVTVFNSLGQKVTEENLSLDHTSVTMNELAKGVYSYRIESGQETQSGRIIKE
ncbi:peptidase S8 [Flavobacterium album]|uniref:Peptidase S8 n=1 Tax=Flavobacterium album TaxID=2175091 RepID=A0A2S1R333_9FLAO|nr:S8 family serine peptidase [Flavobacterium album]AWH87032.1 peptidase S8 [Flavobacterium album]